MIKEQESTFERINVIIQIFWTLVCFYAVLWYNGIISTKSILETNDHTLLAVAIIPVWFTLFEIFEMGTMARIQQYMNIIKQYVFLNVIGSFVLFLIFHLFDLYTMSGMVFLEFAICNIVVLSVQKIIGRTIFNFFRKKGYNSRTILIIADASSIPFIHQIIDTTRWGYRISGIVTSSDEVKEEFGRGYRIHDESENFAHLIDETVIDEVFFCKHDFETNAMRQLINVCREIGVGFHLHNKVLAFGGITPRLTFLNRQFFLSFRNTPENYIELQIKSAIDFFLSLTFLILVSPFMLIIALTIKYEDGGPIIFKQVRVGKHGRLFKCLKFRTMVTNAEEMKEKLMQLNEQDGPVFKIKDDPRITRVGKFLRKTSLDELPQFINVLLGDMSIVGPRPPVPSEVKQYKRSTVRRLSVTPGITCIWQVSGRNNIPFDQWMEMDLQYIDNWSLMLDFMIMLKTIRVILNHDGQ